MGAGGAPRRRSDGAGALADPQCKAHRARFAHLLDAAPVVQCCSLQVSALGIVVADQDLTGVGQKDLLSCHCGSGLVRVHSRAVFRALPFPVCQLSDRHILKHPFPNGEVDKLTDGIFVINHQLKIGNEVSRICDFVSVVTPTIEGDRHLLILHIGDVFDGAGLELKRHNEIKMIKGLSEVF